MTNTIDGVGTARQDGAAIGIEPPSSESEGVPSRPMLASGVELLGEFKGSGFESPIRLVRRDSRFIQVTDLLYRVAELSDGTRDLDHIAAAVSEQSEWLLSADQVSRLLKAKLIPMGIVAPDGDHHSINEEEEEELEEDEDPGEEDPLAGSRRVSSTFKVNLRTRILPQSLIAILTRYLQYLYAPPVLIGVLGACAAGQAWLYLVHGAGPSVRKNKKKRNEEDIR